MKKGFLFKFTILLVALVPLETGNFIQPALAEIAKDLNIGSVLAGYILTLPALASIVFSIISGKLSVTISKKNIIVTGMVLYIIGGVGAAFIADIYWILACRLVLGIGTGLTMPLVMGLVSEFFEGNERATMMGYSQAVGNIGGALGNIVAGYIALISWRFNFFLYLVFAIVLVLIIRLLPNVKPSLKEKDDKKVEEKGKLTIDVFIISLICFMFFVLAMNLTINTILFITEAGLGNTTHTGIAMALVYLFAFPSGMIFGRVFKIIKEQALTLGILFNVVGAFLISNAHSMYLIYAAQALGGFSVGFFLPSCSMTITRLVKKSHHSYGFGILYAGMSIGIFLSPMLIPVFFSVVGAGDYRGLFTLLSGSYAVVAVIAAVYVTWVKKRFIEDHVEDLSMIP